MPFEERDSIGFLGYRYERSKHFSRPILPDGSPSELIDGQNLYHDMLTLRNFPGFEKLTDTQMGAAGKYTCVGLFQYTKNDGTIYLVICYPSKIYSLKAGDTSPTDITGAVTLTGSNVNYFSAVYWADTTSGYAPWIILSNGVDSPIYWAGSGNCAALAGTPPIGKHMSAFANHVFISNITSGGNEYGQRDKHSDVDEPTDWSGGLAGTTDLRQSSGNIQGSIVFGDLRFVFKEYNIAINRSTGYDPPFTYDEDELPVGSLAPRTIGKAMKYDYGFFLGHDNNFYLIRKDGAYFPVGDNIVDRIRTWANDDNLRYAWAAYHPGYDQIILGVPSTNDSSGYCDVLFMFDLGYYILSGEKVWSTPIITGKNFTACTPAKFRQPYTIGDLGDVSSDGTIGGLADTIADLYQEASFTEVALADNNGYIYRLDSSLNYYDATLITWALETKDAHLTGRWTDKFRMLEHELLYRNPTTILATATVYGSTDGGYTFDSGQSPTLYDALGATDQELSAQSWFDVVAKKFRTKITGTYPVRLIGQRWIGTAEGRH